MCGISGIVSRKSNNYQVHLKKMINSIKHRGPDAQGYYYFDNCSLGHARLSIVDLFTGNQPMLNANKKIGIVLNGEIYGYKDIKSQLNYCFTTTSDTEVIIALYEEYGTNLLHKLPGMFAFALWDENKQHLFCARDRFGEKPFYYAITNNNDFIFASEMKAILASGLIEPVLSKKSLVHYIQKGYVHPHKTIYENVFVLPPAHSLIIKDGEIKIDRYWKPPIINTNLSLSDAAELFIEKFKKSVNNQLIADVNVGAFLSGGLDSSSIVAAAVENKKDLKTYSFGFNDDWNELPYARAIAHKYKTKHVEILEKDINIADTLLELSSIFDEPHSDSSNLPTYLISKLASKYEKVVITGDGADELLGGYIWWYNGMLEMLKAKNYSALRRVFILMMASKEHLFAKKLKVKASSRYRSEWKNLSNWRKKKSVVNCYKETKLTHTTKNIELLGLKSYNDFEIDYNHRTLTNTVDDALKEDLENFMVGDILTKVDRASMANSLELRAPFLDVDFAEFCISLPTDFKITSKSDKIILRETFVKDFPEMIQTRAKQGFAAPNQKWLFTDAGLQGLIQEYLFNSSRKIFDILPYNELHKIINENKNYYWNFLVLSLWAENFSFKIN